MKKNIYFGVVAALAISSCASPYALIDIQTMELGNNQYYVEIPGNAYTDKQTLTEYFNRRAIEICGSDKFKSDIEYTSSSRKRPIPGTGLPTFLTIRGTVKCGA